MFQNIRVDIVYYNTNTDFEMEFNLCGCCRMRLLTDKVSDKKTFLHSLARAVSRSKVIIVTGKLFGDDGIISMSASAIGNKLGVVNNKNYGIDSDEEINIINGSVPLVTPEGYFGGCIVENGPQTMILISDSKNIRKSIMKTLIHPYIEELCAAELKEKAAAATPIIPEQDEVLEENQSELPEQDIDVAEIPQEEAPEEAEIEDEDIKAESEPQEGEKNEDAVIENDDSASDDDIELLGGMIFETDEEIYENKEESQENSDFFVKPLYIKKRDVKRINSSYYDFEQDEETDIEYEEFEVSDKVRSSSFNLPILIVSVILLLLIAFLSYCIFFVSTKYGSSAQESIREIYTTLFG